MIMMWAGSILAVPAGWFLCNGSNSTPDLRDRFIVGSGSTYATGASGGSADAIVVSHTHGVTDPSHFHTQPYGQFQTAGPYIQDGSPSLASAQASNPAFTGITINSAGASGTNKNLPPYYALAYIMKS